jgi:hypothetical protein
MGAALAACFAAAATGAAAASAASTATCLAFFLVTDHVPDDAAYDYGKYSQHQDIAVVCA